MRSVPAKGRIGRTACLLAIGLTACPRHSVDPVVMLLSGTVGPGDRVVLARALDPQGSRIAAVVAPRGGSPELRLYDRSGNGEFVLGLTVQKGDSFRNLSLEDVDGDGHAEIVSTWEGGHLEIVEVIAQTPGRPYKSIFQNAGRQVEKRYDPAGRLEFWITSRTYEEAPGQPPAYGTTVYHFSDGAYVEASKNQEHPGKAPDPVLP